MSRYCVVPLAIANGPAPAERGPERGVTRCVDCHGCSVPSRAHPGDAAAPSSPWSRLRAQERWGGVWTALRQIMLSVACGLWAKAWVSGLWLKAACMEWLRDISSPFPRFKWTVAAPAQ